ncbi:DUF2169 domain-containing protein [Serratia sp. DD3]|uniref:DUF2169 family type VI secretion system accessory protein n=1 Tax=Serratia sp. DD3 TaxID=1410619 RepID=UPI0003C51A8A|nr:DUF2169 domain-containing protein [Serratia sp. DD3]KEY59008.1 secreted effector protein pipB2 [Serratia sp. DD3]
MKIIKPLRLSVLSRPYRWQEKNYLGVSVLALADMGSTPRLRPEPELWQLAEKELQTSGGVIDLAIPKACAEFLATGYAYTQHQQDKTACAVRIQVEQREKTLIAFGERHWVNNTPSSPLPFQQMRLDWSRAFGGAQYPENPHGIGASPESFENTPIHRLPNIEPLHHRLTSPRQKPEPESFGALDLMWPRRFSRIGKKYDAHWLQHEFPGFASDIDWRLFNAAPQDQWWENLDELPPEAPWRIWNMHPEKPLQEGHLPPWRSRCFINRLRGDEEVFEEIALRNTTVWFFPHLEQMLLIWHGSARINEDDAADVLQMMPALERKGSPRPVSHYRKVLRQRMDKEKGALFAFREKDLLPENAIGPWLDTDLPVSESPMSSNMQNREQRLREEHRERLEQRGQDIKDIIPAFEPAALPALEDLAEFVEKMEQQAEQMREQAYEKMRERGIDPDKPCDLDKGPKGPESMHRILDMIHRNEHGMSEKKLEQTRQALHQMYLMSVQAQGPAIRLTGDIAQIIRNRAQVTMSRGGDFSGLDFTGADLSGMDLRGADLSKALLENANLSHCQLDGANFRSAMLARADITQASLCDAMLDEACLSLAQCRDSNFTGASLNNVQLHQTLLENCIFDNAKLGELMLYQTYLSQCRFHHARLENMVLMELTAPAMDFSHAELIKVAFIKCTLEQSVFDHATLEGCSWVDTQAEGSRFQGASMVSCSFAAQTLLSGADFRDATLSQCNLRQMPLSGASFHRAKLDNSDLSEANCQRADMSKMNAIGSLFMRTDLRGASLNDSNLMGALMQKCNFSGADLRGANLFRTDMSQSTIDATTKIDGAYTQRTKTLPKRDKDLI